MGNPKSDCGNSLVARTPVALMVLSTAILTLGAVWILVGMSWPLPARLIFGGLVVLVLFFELRKLRARLILQRTERSP